MLKVEQEYFSPADVVRMTGLSRQTVYRALQAGRLEGLLFNGSLWKIRREWVGVWLEKGVVRAPRPTLRTKRPAPESDPPQPPNCRSPTPR